MIIFKKVRYKNFLSTGQQFIEINLNEAPTTLVVGHNGAGKSTAMKAMFGMLHLGKGRVMLDGTDIGRLKPQERVLQQQRSEQRDLHVFMPQPPTLIRASGR